MDYHQLDEKWDINNVLEIIDLDKPIDGTKELGASRIVEDKEDIQKIKNW